MIDSVLKGIGNSRFLKSAVPAGTSWADALAMLQAGTFPIDFNGINNEGFQQVGTPLNKANLLKDATAAQIGLPPSTTPDGMFQALGNTGELHVWRKTVTTAQEIPAGYTLGNTEENVLIASRETSYMAGALYYYYGNSITVSDNGNASNPASDSYEMIGRGYTTAKTILSGPVFVKCATDYISSSTGQQTAMPTKEGLSLFFIPSGGNLVVTVSDYPGNSSIKVVSVVATKYQLVNAYPLTPAGTTTTYPVSTNPNAYQDGNDKQPSGYTLGDVQTGSFSAVGPNTTVWRYSDSVTVDDDGNISLDNYGTIAVAYSDRYVSDNLEKLRGKFAIVESRSSDNPPYFDVGVCYFFPADVVFTMGTSLAFWYCNKYQIATGYAAIPAGTIIEYLGKLGDKARVQVVSYVGTGTCGENNKNSLTFDFPPKIILIAMAQLYSNQTYTGILYPFVGCGSSFLGSSRGYVYSLLCNRNGNSVSWWNETDYGNQLNISGYKYTAIAIG